MTYAYKYMLLRIFAIPTGEDPDKISSAETDYKIQSELNADKIIDKTKVDALNKSIENAGIKDEVVELILSQYGYNSTSEIQMKNYMQIIQDFKSKK